MAEVFVFFKDKKLREFIKRIDKKTKEYRNRKKNFITAISAMVFRDIIDHYEKEQGPKSKWKAWSAAYRRQMAKRGKGGNKILQDTGFLRQNVRAANVRKVSEGILWFNPAKTKSGFGYAKHHDKTRPFMWLSKAALKNIGRITLKKVLE